MKSAGGGSGRRQSSRLSNLISLIAAGAIAYIAIPADAWESLAWQAVTAIDRSDAYAWYLRQWPSDANAAKVRAQAEEAVWLQSSRSDQYEDYAGYLATYPNGQHADAARVVTEARLWERVVAIGLEGSYRAYLADYPAGAHAREAAEAIKSKPALRAP